MKKRRAAGIGADRILQLREEIERMCKIANLKEHSIDHQTLDANSEARRRLRQ